MRKKTSLEIETDWIKNRKCYLDKKWHEYISNLPVKNINQQQAYEMMEEQNAFAYKLISLKREDLL